MAHITSQTATKAQSSAAVPTSEICTDLEEDSGDSLKEGTHRFAKSVSDSVVSSMSPNSFMAEEKPELGGIEAEVVSSSASASFEDTSSGGAKKKKKQLNKCVKQKEKNKVIVRDNSRSDGRTIKGGSSADSAVSCVVAELEEGCDSTLLNLATTNMERVNHPDMFSSFGRSSSPYASSDNDWEASDHSDTDADHSDSSDDDNPTSQVDRMIERGARLIMDGENSNLSSETDDTDDSDFDSDSDITDVSPLVSNPGSPLGLSPVMSRRNLPSSISSKPPFMRHYSHKGHDGDVEDETEEELGTADFAQHWRDDLYHHHHDDNNTATSDTHINNSDNNPSHNMSMVVQALLQFGLESSRKNSQDNNENIDSVNQNDMSLPHVIRNRRISPVIQVNPHHRHLRKNNHHSRRKNMSFTNEEVRIINQDNSTMLEKLIAVSGRQQEETHFNPSYRQNSKPATSCINRKNKEEGIQKDNLALLRRLQEVKPSRAVTATSRNSSSKHHHHHHHHHHRDHHHHRTPPLATPTATTTSAKSCSATARNASYSQAHHHHHHHSPKETAL